MLLSALLLFFLLTAIGCSQVNVEMENDSRPPHEKIFPEDMKGRSPDYERPGVLAISPVEYPAEAADLNVAGIVMVKMLIGMKGEVLEAEIQQGVHPLVDEAALETARGGLYAPANEFGAATEGWLTVPFRYPPPLEAKE